MQISFPALCCRVSPALGRGLQCLQRTQQMLLSPKPPSAFKLQQGYACLALPQKIPPGKPKMLAGAMVRKFTPEPVPAMELRDGRRPGAPSMGPGGTLGQDKLGPHINPCGMLLSSRPGLGRVTLRFSPPNRPLLWKDARRMNPGLAKSFGIFQDQKYHQSVRHCRYHCYTQGSYQLKAAIPQGSLPFTPALKMPTKRRHLTASVFHCHITTGGNTI